MGTEVANANQDPGTREEQGRYGLLLALTRGFNAHTELDTLLPFVIQRCREVLNAEGCSLLLVDEETQELYFPVTSSRTPGIDAQLEGLRFPVSEGIAGEVIRKQQALFVAEAGHHKSFYSEVDKLTGARTHDMLCAPLRSQGGVLGVVEVLNCLKGGFSDEDLEFLDALAGSIAIAVENANLVDGLRLSKQRLEREVTTLQRERVQKDDFPEIIGCSLAISRVISLMESAVHFPVTVQIQGETGVGKEVVAQAIHAHGPRRDSPLVALDCGAMPSSLLESELFGFCRGAFTGAQHDKAGLFEAADGSTLFLDEIDALSLDQQAKLLRVLQEGELRRLGETRTRRVDVRVISATNRNLETEVREKRFREDLYYRLNVFPIEIPPLRERPEDIPLLAVSLLQRVSKRLGLSAKSIEPDALEDLVAYDWPGNVRELENELERATALTAPSASISRSSLSEHISRTDGGQSRRRGLGGEPHGNLQTARREFERQYVISALDRHDGNATRAARDLGISRQMLQRKIRDWKLREPRRSREESRWRPDSDPGS